MSEKTIGFSIEIRGTDSQIGKMGDLKREILANEDAINKLKSATKDNIGAQKASASQMAQLQTNLKGLKSEYNLQAKEVLNTAKANKNAVGSYNDLSNQLRVVSAQWKELSAEERDNTEAGKLLTEQRKGLISQLTELDSKVGVNVRNVGNYSSAFTKHANTLRGLQGPTKLLSHLLGIEGDAINQVRIVTEHALQGAAQYAKGKEESATATAKDTVVTEANTVATEQQTIAQRIYNAVKNASLGIWIAVGLAVAAGAALLVEYYSASESANESLLNSQKAMDGTIIKSDELRKAHNDHLIAVGELDIEYRILNGTLTETEGALEKVALKTKVSISNINNQIAKEITETRGFWNSLWNDIKDLTVLAPVPGKFSSQITEELKIIEEGGDKIAAEKQRAADEAAIIKLNKDKAEKDEADRLHKELLEKIKNYNDSILAFRKEYSALLIKEEHEYTRFLKEEEEKRNNDQKKADEDRYKLQISSNKKTLEELEKEGARLRKKREDEEKAHQDRMAKIQGAGIDASFQLANNFVNMKYSLMAEANARELQESLDKLTDLHDTEISALEERLKSGAITEAQFKIQKEDEDKRFREKEREQKEKAFEEDKKLKIQQIGIQTAIAIAEIWLKSLAETAPIVPAGVALAGIATGVALGNAAIQVSAIENSKFQEGGLLNGPSHSQGGIPFSVGGRVGFEAEGGEAIINKRATSMFSPLLSAINQAGGGRSFAMGGIPSVSSTPSISLAQSGFDLTAFANRIVNGINDKKVYNVESESRAVSNRVANIESATTF